MTPDSDMDLPILERDLTDLRAERLRVRHIDAGIEHGRENDKVADYRSVAYYYVRAAK